MSSRRVGDEKRGNWPAKRPSEGQNPSLDLLMDAHLGSALAAVDAPAPVVSHPTAPTTLSPTGS